MKKTLFKILIVLVGFTVKIDAQKVWTLEECIGYALDNNLQIKRQTLQTDIAKNNLLQSIIDLAPDLGASAGHAIGSGRVLNNNYTFAKKTSGGSLGLASSIIIFKGFQKLNTIKMNKYNLLSSLEDLEKLKNDIALNIAGGYLQILFNKELLEVTKSQLDVTKLQIEKTKKLYEVGNVAKGALLEIQATASTEEANLIAAQNDLNLANLTLAQMLDLDTVKGFTVYLPGELNVPEKFSDDPDSVYRIALGNMPQIKSAEYGLKQSESALAVARGGRSPQLSLTGYYSTQYEFYDSLRQYDPITFQITRVDPYPIRDQLKNKMYKSISMNLSIPIFGRFQIQKEICNAKIRVRDAEFALRQSQLQLRKDIEQAYADAIASFENFKSRQKTVDAQEENFKYVQQKFDVGLINSVDYSVAKNSYTKAKSDLLHAKYEFIFKTKILDFYKGNVIKL